MAYGWIVYEECGVRGNRFVVRAGISKVDALKDTVQRNG
jgi:hypothetical protein